MKKLAASYAPAGALQTGPHPFGRAALEAPGITVLMVRDGDAKARLLGSLQHELAAASPTAAANGWAPPRALFVHSQDLTAAAALIEGELRGRIDASPETRARAAIAGLQAGAAALLAADGSGRIALLRARLRDLDDRLAAALQAERATRARCEACLDDAAGAAALANARDRAVAAHAHWRTLIRLWPDWQRLQQIRRELAAAGRFERVPDDAEQRHAALEERWQMAQRAVREAAAAVSALHREREGLRAAVERLSADAAEHAARLCAEIPAYRSRLLQLAAARARFAELEHTLASGVERLGRSWDVVQVSETVVAAAQGDELRRWQERSRSVFAAHAEAERAQAAARERARELCARVSEQLSRDGLDGDDEIDARWRCLWKLRADLEEIWDVQSRAESTARTLADREDEWRRLDASRYWTPPRWLLATLTGLAAAATATLASGFLKEQVPTAALAALVLALILARIGGHMRARWVGVLEQRGALGAERAQREIATLRRRRDEAWKHAALLTARIRTAGERLALPDPVTPEAVESCEQDQAAQLRADGASTELTALLLDLLLSEDHAQHAAARLRDADAQRQSLAREWESWRSAAGFPADIELEGLEERLAELQRLTQVRAARDAARGELRRIEPLAAAWEAEARGALERAGAEVQPQLCGSALAAELGTLAARARAEAERRARRARLASELPDAERRLAEANAELAHADAARKQLLDAAGATDATALQALLDGVRQWRANRERARRLEASIDDRLERLACAVDARAELAGGDRQRWYAELQRSKAELSEIRARADEAEARQHAAEECLAAARTAAEPAELRLEREAVLAELRDAAREWKLHTLAAALIDTALFEQRRAGTSELLTAASRTLAALTRGRYTGIARSEYPAGLVLVDRDGSRLPLGAPLGPSLLGQVQLSVLLARGAQLADRGSALPLVLDDVLGPLAVDDAHLVAEQLAAFARAHPVLYLTTAAHRGRVLSALPAGTAVVEVD